MKVRYSGKSKGGGKLGVGCMVVFALPFLCFGIGAGVIALQRLMKPGGLTDPESWFLLVFHVVFTAVGLGLPWLAIKGGKEARLHADKLEANKDALWLTRDDWASGRIDYDGSGAVKGLLFFAVIWNAISWPATYGAITQEFLGKGKKEALIVLLFPLVGLGLISAVVYGFMQARRFGKSRFVMEQIPAAIGTVMRGIVVTGVQRSLAADIPFIVRFTCFRRRVTGSGKNRSVKMIPLWHDERRFKGTPRRDDPDLLAVPVQFDIPSDMDSVTLDDSDNRILWQLKITAEVPGVDYSAEFELPVFRTPDSPESGEAVVDDGASNVAFETIEEEKEVMSTPKSRGISMGRMAGGAGVEFKFAAMRNIGPVIGLTIFQTLWAGAIWFMIEKGAPIFFPIVFGGCFVVLLFVLFGMITTAGKVTASSGRLSIIRGPFGLGTAKEVRADEVKSIAITMGMQSGQTYYYDLFVRSKAGKKIKIVSSLKDKDEAEWMGRCLARAAGLPEDIVRAGRGRDRKGTSKNKDKDSNVS